MKLSEKQRLISDSGARFRVAICGRRFGKTYLAMNEVAKIARFPGRRIFLVYPTYRQARQVIWEIFKYKLQDLNWIKKINETDLTMILKNGSRISLRGADNPDSLRGVGLDAVVMDEFAMIEEKAWTEVLRPTLSDKGGSALFISTPYGTQNWAYDLYQRGLDPTEHQWESFQFTTLDGGNVPLEEIEQARRDLDARTFRQEYEATFENYVGRIYYAFDRAVNVRSWEQDIPAILHVGLDFNVGMMSASIFAQNKDIIHAIDEIALYSSNTTEIVEEIRARYPKQKIFVYPDPSGSARKTSASGATDHTILANAGFVVKAPHKHNPVRDGINAVNSRLKTTTGEHKMFVDPRCKKIIESLEKHCYKEGTSQPDKDSGFDHFSDSIRYCIDYMFPIKKDRDPNQYQPRRWGHAIAA
jgi:hypothetical protein